MLVEEGLLDTVGFLLAVSLDEVVLEEVVLEVVSFDDVTLETVDLEDVIFSETTVKELFSDETTDEIFEELFKETVKEETSSFVDSSIDSTIDSTADSCIFDSDTSETMEVSLSEFITGETVSFAELEQPENKVITIMNANKIPDFFISSPF